uniref:NADH-ubiquinone oxidoreductase chain 3 n=1 Tax=Bicellonychia lividipennis TaxID=1176499 RepID=A0A158V4K8_9COLE|nr:NADH dehydrogenase subunit 3 [Bicellonychia lividipennis]AIQ80141.1 NADH dehydrogenase subunit 3 [Bicellonychia lividipennis]
MIITILSITIFLISFALIIINNLISFKMITDREKSSPFECGFDPKSSPRMPFSLQFFLIAMIFLIFDIEITLLLPIIVTMKISNPYTFIMISSIFILILLIGLYHEWKQGALNWAY